MNMPTSSGCRVAFTSRESEPSRHTADSTVSPLVFKGRNFVPQRRNFPGQDHDLDRRKRKMAYSSVSVSPELVMFPDAVEVTDALNSAAYQVARKTRTGTPRLAAGWGLVATYPAGAPAVCSRSLSASRAFPQVVSSVRSFIRPRTIGGCAALDRGPVRPGRGLRPAGLTRGVRRHPLPVLQHPGVPGLAV